MKPKILLVDDDHILRRYICRVLSDFEVIEAGTVGEAIKLFGEFPNLAAVISDYHIQDGNGLALRSWIRKRSPIPFLLISGSLPNAPEIPDLTYLAKPFRPQQLLEILNGLIERTTLPT